MQRDGDQIINGSLLSRAATLTDSNGIPLGTTSLSDGVTPVLAMRAVDADGTSVTNVDPGRPIDGQSLQDGGAGQYGWLSSVRKAVSDLATSLVLSAGSAIIGKVGIDQTTPGVTNGVQINAALPSRGYSSGKVSITRPNDTTAYTAGDVVGAAAAAITFPTMGPAAGGEIMITSLTFERDVTALISGETSYRLHLYSVTPPSALADNAVWDLPSGDRAAYLGFIDVGTPVDFGSSLWVEQNGINMQITLASGTMYGYLVTNGGFTPAAVTVNELALHSVGV